MASLHRQPSFSQMCFVDSFRVSSTVWLKFAMGTFRSPVWDGGVWLRPFYSAAMGSCWLHIDTCLYDTILELFSWLQQHSVRSTARQTYDDCYFSSRIRFVIENPFEGWSHVRCNSDATAKMLQLFCDIFDSWGRAHWLSILFMRHMVGNRLYLSTPS